MQRLVLVPQSLEVPANRVSHCSPSTTYSTVPETEVVPRDCIQYGSYAHGKRCDSRELQNAREPVSGLERKPCRCDAIAPIDRYTGRRILMTTGTEWVKNKSENMKVEGWNCSAVEASGNSLDCRMGVRLLTPVHSLQPPQCAYKEIIRQPFFKHHLAHIASTCFFCRDLMQVQAFHGMMATRWRFSSVQMTSLDDLQTDSDFVDALSRLGSRTSSGISAFSESPAQRCMLLLSNNIRNVMNVVGLSGSPSHHERTCLLHMRRHG